MGFCSPAGRTYNAHWDFSVQKALCSHPKQEVRNTPDLLIFFCTLGEFAFTEEVYFF